MAQFILLLRNYSKKKPNSKKINDSNSNEGTSITNRAYTFIKAQSLNHNQTNYKRTNDVFGFWHSFHSHFHWLMLYGRLQNNVMSCKEILYHSAMLGILHIRRFQIFVSPLRYTHDKVCVWYLNRAGLT